MAFRDSELGPTVVTSLRGAVVTSLRAAFPPASVPVVRAHRGAFNPSSVARYSRKSPAIFVVLHGTDNVERMGDGKTRTRVSMSAVAITNVGDGDDDDASVAMVETLIRLVPNEDWDLDDADGAENVRAQNLYSDKLDDKRVNMWAVTWEQGICMPAMTTEDFDTLEDYLRTHATSTPSDAGDDDPAPEQQFDQR